MLSGTSSLVPSHSAILKKTYKRIFMINILALLLVGVAVSGCSAPKPPQVSLTGNLSPVNFFNTTSNDRNEVIQSEQKQHCWRQEFSYSIDDQNPSPEFFYAVAHADRIIARVKPPFIGYVFPKIQENLKSYGIATPIALFVEEESSKKSQVILDCIKFSCER